MIPLGTKVYFSVLPADLRRSFDGLSTLAASVLKEDPTKGGLFVFLNKRANQVRVLFRDPHGWCVLAKRLDQGRFRRPRVENGRFSWQTDPQTLMRFLDDIDLSGVMHRRRKHHAHAPMQLVQVDLRSL